MALSDKQLAANRANAQKSTGPTSVIGKRNSSRNSLKHGLLSDIILINGESAERLNELASSITDEYDPETPSQEMMVQNAVAAMWFLMRCWAVGAAGLNHEMKVQAPSMTDEDAATRAMLAFRSLCDNSRHLDLLSRYQHRYERQYFRAIAALDKMRDERNARAERTRHHEENKQAAEIPEPISSPPEPIQSPPEPVPDAPDEALDEMPNEIPAERNAGAERSRHPEQNKQPAQIPEPIFTPDEPGPAAPEPITLEPEDGSDTRNP